MNIDQLFELILQPPTGLLPAPETAAKIRTSCEDFQVEEVPAYLPEGSGEHLFLWIEKRNIASPDLLRHIGKALALKERDIGIAGQKDKAAVTLQFVSVPAAVREQVDGINTDAIRVRLISGHRNKLRTGHLQGNRFCITARPLPGQSFSEAQVEQVRSQLQAAASDGFPNYFGPQRFGKNGRNLRKDRRLQTSEGTPPPRGSRAARFNVSVWQAAVFNLVLAERVRQQTFQKPLADDVVCRRGGIRPFLFADRGSMPAEELVPMGPMPGPKMMPAGHDAAAAEQHALDQLGLSAELFAAQGKRAPGTRRRLVEFPRDCRLEQTSDGALQVHFELSAGSFATVLLAELFYPLVDASASGDSAAAVSAAVESSSSENV